MHRRVGSGVPGNGTVRQSAYAKSELGIVTTSLLTPLTDSLVKDTRLESAVFVLARSRPGPGRSCVAWRAPPDCAATAMKRSTTLPVTPFATGTSMPSWLDDTPAMVRSPCHALLSTTSPRRHRKFVSPAVYGMA